MSSKHYVSEKYSGCLAENTRTQEEVSLIALFNDDPYLDIWVVEDSEGALYLEHGRNLENPFRYGE